jgi:hypothetical protein
VNSTKFFNFIEIILGKNQFCRVNLINLKFHQTNSRYDKIKKKEKKTTLFGYDVFFQFSDVMSLASILKERLIIKMATSF